GLARPVYSAYGSTCWCYTADVPHRDYDLGRAAALLDEAGLRLGPDAMRRQDGQPVRLRLLYGPSGSVIRAQTAAIVRESSREFDLEQRRRIYQEIQRVLVEDQAYIFLYENMMAEGINNRIGGIRPSPLGLEWNIHEWYVK